MSSTVYRDYPEADLLADIKSGSRAAFNELYNRYFKLLFIHADKKLQDPDEAADVIQNVFIKVWEKRDKIEISAHLSSYLYGMVRNELLNFIKQKATIKKYADAFYRLGTPGQSQADELIREKQFRQMIEAEIAALPPRMREVFELRRIENLSTKEVAEKLGISEDTVADQLKKALRRLKFRIGLMIIIMQIFG